MKLSPRAITLFLLIVMALLIGLWITREKPAQRTPSQQQAEPPPRSVVFPPITPIRSQESLVAVSFSAFTFTPPEELTQYRTNPVDLPGVAKTIALQLGFSGEPRKIPSARLTYLWNTEAAAFSAQEAPPSFYYRLTSPAPGPPIPQLDHGKTVQAFLSRIGVAATQPVKITVGRPSFVKTLNTNIVPATSAQEASFASVDTRYTIDNYPLLQRGALNMGGSALIDKSGAISSFSVTLPPVIIASQTKKTLSLAQAKTLLEANRGALISIGTNTTSDILTPILDVSVSAITINRAEVAYVYLDQTNSITPMYLFSGIVKEGSKSSIGATASYLTPALVD